MQESPATAFRQQLESLYSISIEIARLHELQQVLDRALGFCRDLTQSAFGFIGLLVNDGREVDVAAIKGFVPLGPKFYDHFGVVITNESSKVSNDVLHDADRVGQPRGHPPVRTFLGVPLQVGDRVIGMVGVANKPSGYTTDEERLLSTFANQVAVAIENARLYEEQQRMIDELEKLHRDLSQAEREQVLRQERERIAAELHDRIEQAIFTLGLKVNEILEREKVTEPIAAGLGDVRQLAIHTSEAVREAIFALSLPRPAAGGLLFELRRLVREAGKAHELEADLVVSGEPLRLSAESEQTLYVLAREALANVVRHARARRVLVSLRYSGDQIDLVIQDDGVGASEQILNHYQESGTHFGMKRSRRQVEDLGGSFEVCRRLVRTHPAIEVVILTTYTDGELVQECLQAGARGYVVKDVERFSLKESIRAVHRGQAVLAPQVAGEIIERMRSPQSDSPLPATLNRSQLAILRLISRGHSNREIAAVVHLSENTVKAHIQEIFRKLGVRNRVEAAILAGKSGWR